MKEFMNECFMLNNETGKVLYNKYAKDMPIFDYHCHLPIEDIYNDKKFSDITDCWLVDKDKKGDHYKWRAMRGCGIDEEYITGDKSNYEKFKAWASTVPYLIGNPLYHWVHMELKTFFNINKTLSLDTCDEIWNEANKKLETLTARKMIEMSNVKIICTTDDPVDSLIYHIKLKEDKSFNVTVLPAYRPDKAMNIEKADFKEYIDKLGNVSNIEIKSIDDLEDALKKRAEFFKSVGCLISDHGLDSIYYKKSSKEEVNNIFVKSLNKIELTQDDIEKYKTYMLLYFGRLYHKLGFVQQYHMNAIRNNSLRMFNKLGPDTGFDGINDTPISYALSHIMSDLDYSDELPKTILYSLNPSDNETLISIGTSFNRDYVSKIQFGSAWWFNDQKKGMEEQLKVLSSIGVISKFVGMLTDSRSFLSYTRHDYFRRILCNYLGELIEDGEYPNDIEFVGNVIKDISYNNAIEYFNIKKA